MSDDEEKTEAAQPAASKSDNQAEALRKQLESLSLSAERQNLERRPIETISPSDFVTLQRLRSSGLACKLKTTSKNHDDTTTLYDDLINVYHHSDDSKIISADAVDSDGPENQAKILDEEDGSGTSESHVVVERVEGIASNGASKMSDAKVCEDDGDNAVVVADADDKGVELDDKGAELVARGPVRNIRTVYSRPPYSVCNECPPLPQVCCSINTENSHIYCDLPPVGQEWIVSVAEAFDYCASSGSTPEAVHSDLGYSSASPSYQVPSKFDNGQEGYTKRADSINQLPDDLSDFILKYSRCYTETELQPVQEDDSKLSPHNSSINNLNNHKSDATIECSKIKYDSPLYRILVEDDCKSPLSARSAPQFSPVSPASQMPTFTELKCSSDNKDECGSKRTDPGARPARDRLRALINDDEMSEAWAWTCKCVQKLKGALCHQDMDGDSLLHIVIQHIDLAKIYALVEQMLKTSNDSVVKPFDVSNHAGETPLYLAVLKKSTIVVAYLIEAGANPNHRTCRSYKQAPLHYAASLGLGEIVEACVLCASSIIDPDLPDGYGSSALLIAVKNHLMTIKDSTAHKIDSKLIIRLLLDRGADPTTVDAYGNTVMHYAVDKLDPDLIELLKSYVDDETLTKLVNKENKYGETPLDRLRSLSEQHDEWQRSSIFISLLRCGATIKVQ